MPGRTTLPGQNASTDRLTAGSTVAATRMTGKPIRCIGPRKHSECMPVIEVRHLHKRYGDLLAVNDVSFAVERGEIFGVIGPNGAGKPPPSSASAACAAPTAAKSESSAWTRSATPRPCGVS